MAKKNVNTEVVVKAPEIKVPEIKPIAPEAKATKIEIKKINIHPA